MASTNRPVFVREEGNEWLGDNGVRRFMFRARPGSAVEDRDEIWSWVQDQFPNSLRGDTKTIYWGSEYEIYIMTNESEAMTFRLRWC